MDQLNRLDDIQSRFAWDFAVPADGYNGADVWGSSAEGQYVIFSIDAPSEGRAAYTDAFLRSKDVGFKRLVGSWEGEEEPSWIVNAKDWNEKVRFTGLVANQHCVLHLGPAFEPGKYGGFIRCARKATLYFNDGRREVFGRMLPQNATYAQTQPGWTRDADGQYYVCG